MLLIAIFYLLVSTSSINHEPVYLYLPLNVSDQDWRPLRETLDSDLQKKLEARLNANELWAVLIKKKRMAVGLVDLSYPESIRFASVNGDTMLYAASLPKIAILLTACQAFEDGTLQETPKIMKDLKDMIQYSGNESASRMIDRLGFKKIEAVLTNPKYRLFDPQNGGGIWVGKRFARYGGRHPDPMKGLSHAANVTQVCRFYYLLATGRLINPQRCRQMLDILSNTKLKHKFVFALNKITPKVRIYRKSGTWEKWHADSVLVWGNDHRRYILVGLISDGRGEQILRQLVRVAEAVLYDSSKF